MPIIDIQSVANEYRDFLNQWEWQLHITLSFRRPVHTGRALSQARGYLNKLKRDQPKLKFAGAILSTKGQSRCHIHILLLCDTRYPVNLKTLSIFTIKENWHRGTMNISDNSQWSNETITNYLTKKKNLNLSDPDSYDIDFYRPGIMRQLQRERGQ